MSAGRFKWVSAVAFAAAGLASVPSHAAVVLFQDSFDTDSASSVLNFSAFNNWTVGNGTVDYVRSGDFGIACFGGTGGCVDIDGSTGNGGRIETKTSFNLLASETYQLTIRYSGNQRLGPADSLSIGVASFTLGIVVSPSTPFTLQTLTVGGLAESGVLFIETSSADNIGPIIDDVTFTCTTCKPTSVPEPSALALLSIGLIGCLRFARSRVSIR
jgi:hypothetical protein